MSFNTDVESVENITSTDVQHTTINKENVQVSSEISHDAINKVALNIGSDKLNDLMDRLSTTHAQLDNYTQRRTQQISIETQNIIKKILEETKEKQRDLLNEAQMKSQLIQEQYQNDLQIKINQLNEEKALQLADLEKNLNIQQESILNNARQNIDELQRDANQVRLLFIYLFQNILVFFFFKRKMNILQKAQEVTNARLEQITDQVVSIGQEDSANRLASSTTVVITSQAVAQGQTEQIHTNTQQTLIQS